MEERDAGTGVPEQATEVLDVRAQSGGSRGGGGDSPQKAPADEDGITHEIGAVAVPEEPGGLGKGLGGARAEARRVTVPSEILDASFSLAIRGYDRRQVDAYVERVERVVAALQRRRSPQAAVKLALDRVGVQTAGVLQRAREAAEQITATALSDAEHVTRRAKVEAEETVERAEREAEAMLRDAGQRAESARRRAADELSAIDRDVALARELQLRALNGIRSTAAELEQFAQALERRRELAKDGDAPDTEGTGDEDVDGDGELAQDAVRARRITRRPSAVGLVDWAASAGDER
jgi:DivIVA domain-containing protein